MSLYIDATTPDLANYVPNSGGMPLPPIGSYPGIYHVVGGEPGETKNKEPKFEITFEASEGDLKGQRFQIHYNTGSSNAISRRIAIQNIMDIAAGITGVNYTGQRFSFDEKMYFKPFNGVLVVTAQVDKNTNQVILDDNGHPRKNVKFTQIKPLDNAAPTHAPVGAPQQGYQPAGAPQTAAGTPPWGPR